MSMRIDAYRALAILKASHDPGTFMNLFGFEKCYARNVAGHSP